MKLPDWYVRLDRWAQEETYRYALVFFVVPFILGAIPAPLMLLIFTLTGDIEW